MKPRLGAADRRSPLLLVLTSTILLGYAISLWFALLPAAIGGRADFSFVFGAAGLIWHGAGSHIYDQPPFNHLAFEPLFLSPLAELRYAAAFLIFLAANCALFALALRKLRLSGWRAVAAFSFIPVTVCFMQGQDSIFSLFALSCALVWLASGRDVEAGLIVGLTIYKPQIGLIICGLMFLWRRWRFVAGFAASSAACVAISIAATGTRTFLGYLELLRSMDQIKYEIVMRDMVSLRGLLAACLTGHALAIATAITTVSVLAAFFLAGRRLRPELQLALTVCAVCLASYHLLIHDLVIILVPMSLIAIEEVPLSWSALLILVAPAFALTSGKEFLLAIPVAAFSALFVWKLRMEGATEPSRLRPLTAAAIE